MSNSQQQNLSFLTSLIPLLPRYAEEGGDHYSVSRIDLECKLAKQCLPSESDSISIRLDAVESLLISLSVLDRAALGLGNWSFVSFPAQLMATSILTTMSDPNSSYFPENFWVTNGISDDDKNRQRETLHFFEDARFTSHKANDAAPIRFIYVAWSLIKIGGKFLFHQREDTKKRHNIKSGDYGLIGGRINSSDISYVSDVRERLELLQSDQLVDDDLCFENALKREISEEIGLEYEVHYTFSPMRALEPYQQVEGAAPNHGLTRYFFRLFTVELTKHGYLELNKKMRMAGDNKLIWCSVGDILKQNSNGNLLYIQALHDHYKDGLAGLERDLDGVSDCYLPFNIEKSRPTDAIVFPSLPNQNIKTALHGSKHLKKYETENDLSDEDVRLLLGMAAHARCFSFESVVDGLDFLPSGWIDVEDNPVLCRALLDISERLPELIEKHCDHFFRLSVDPEIIFFDEMLFEYDVDIDKLYNQETDTSKNIEFLLFRKAIDTSLGVVRNEYLKEKTTKTRIRFFDFCYDEEGILLKGFVDEDDQYAKAYDTIRSVMDKWSKKIGLRKAIGQSDSMYKVFIQKKESGNECIHPK